MALSGTSSKCVQLTKFKKLGLLTSCVKEEAVLTFQLPDWWMCSARLSFGLTKIQGKKHVRELQRKQAQTMPHDTGDTISCSRCTLLRESVQLFNGTIFALQKMFLLHGISSAHTHTHNTWIHTSLVSYLATFQPSWLPSRVLYDYCWPDDVYNRPYSVLRLA